MENQKEKSYPVCFQCAKLLNPQDSNGWENFTKLINEIIWVCPDCMYKTELGKKYIKETEELPILAEAINKYVDKDRKRTRLLADFKYLLDSEAHEDSPKEIANG